MNWVSSATATCIMSVRGHCVASVQDEKICIVERFRYSRHKVQWCTIFLNDIVIKNVWYNTCIVMQTLDCAVVVYFLFEGPQ